MKILHTPFDISTGGREVFIRKLIENFPDKTVEHRIMTEDEEEKTIDSDGIKVHILKKAKTKNFRYSYFSGIYDEIPGFEELLDTYKPHIVHFHDQGISASLSHLRICKKKGIKTLLTFHSPGQFCMQRTLRYCGQIPCNGIIDLYRCTVCSYRCAGIPYTMAKIASHLKPSIDKTGKIFKANAVDLFYKHRKEYFETVDAIQVHAHWAEELFLNFGINKNKIHYIEMGGQSSIDRELWKKEVSKPIKAVFIGRCQEIKGVHLIVDAIKMLPNDAPIEVHFFGPYWEKDNYGKPLLEKITGDKRFCQPRLIPQNNIREELCTMDICIIPSLWPETGPFTVFDAFSVGLPVIGTNLAGIAERVKHGENGLLFQWNDTNDLFNKLLSIIKNPELITKLKQGIKQNHTFEQMSSSIMNIYENIL
ncbi:MAG: glycosyltransferase [Bacteroidales bacterium]